MRAVVKQRFHDVVEGVVREPGDSFECSKERFDEINGKLSGFVEAAPRPAAKKQASKK